jgi:hypothetical protein
MPRRRTTEQFIAESRAKHGEVYDYSKTVYMKRRSPVVITCRLHGDFRQQAAAHLAGRGCRKCGHLKLEALRTKYKIATTAEFITRSQTLYGDRFDYSKVEFSSRADEVTIICKRHGEYRQKASIHLGGKGCHLCGKEKQPKTTAQFVSAARGVHGDRFSYHKSKYISCKAKLVIGCRKHGDFLQSPKNHLGGNGCEKCANENRPVSRKGSASCHWIADREYVESRKRLSSRCHVQLRRTLKTIGKKKEGRSRDLLGYTTRQLIEHLTSHPEFESVKYSKWEIDHIFPISAFFRYGITHVSVINCLENLRPTTRAFNRSKANECDDFQFLCWVAGRLSDQEIRALFGTRDPQGQQLG